MLLLGPENPAVVGACGPPPGFFPGGVSLAGASTLGGHMPFLCAQASEFRPVSGPEGAP